jgi:hypothetical protein
MEGDDRFGGDAAFRLAVGNPTVAKSGAELGIL